MHISGTFLKSKIAQRIALILFLAAFIPTALITGLTYNTVNRLVTNHSHKELVDNSHNYALSVFSNLIFARTNLVMIANEMDASNLTLQEKLNKSNYPMFSALLVATPEGQVLNKTRDADNLILQKHKSAILAAINTASLDKTKLLVLPASVNNKPSILLILPRHNHANTKTLLIGEINPQYLWGDPEDYPAEINVCAYRIDGDSKRKLFCSADEHVKFQGDMQPENIGNWELFIRGEFQDNNWSFVSQRQNLVSINPLGSFLSSYGYVGAAIFSLLLVALLSLIQIRRTMVPLELLIEGTRKISQGEFTQVQVKGHSEFSELADSFNGMSADIKRQLNTLQSLSAIDREMAANLNVDQLIHQVIARIQTLMPTAIICITRLNEESGTATQCSNHTSDNILLLSQRITIPNQELAVIKNYGSGQLRFCKKESGFSYENFLAELGAKYSWTLPIFWQGEMCAFLSVSDQIALQQDDANWDEIRELAGRIGIAISAQAREDQLLIQAQYDSLTGLPNRILLQDRLRQAIELSNRSGKPFWLAFIDLDRFKFINDSLGHKGGDQLLSEVSRRLQSTVRDSDTVARFGGDEFIVILQGDMDDALSMSMLNRLITAVEVPFRIEGNEIITTCSIGISVYPTDTSNADVLMSNADIAMYRAKELGKNNFQFFMQSMNEKVADRLRLETHLRKALELNELEVFYQPKVDLHTKKIVGMEALIRWNCKALGFINPDQFISLAEETGLIVPIGEWVLKTSCAQAVAWRKAGLGELRMAVNLSVRQFGQKDLLESIAHILKETGMDAQQLELELTESMIMSDTDEADKILCSIKSLGIHLAIDDFGTGYSSLSYLKNLPIDTLKIDKSFTDDIVSRNDEAPIVASILALAKNLKLNVVTEGVENYEQVLYLSTHGCNQIQGYYFSKPAPAEVIEVLLKEDKRLEPPQLVL